MKHTWYIRAVLALVLLGGTIFAIELSGAIAEGIDAEQRAGVPHQLLAE